MISFIKNNKTLSIILILVFIFLLIIGKSNFIWWVIDGALILILIITVASKKYKQAHQESHLPENMNYHRIFININRHNQKLLGKSHHSITYMYINTNSKLVTFPESRYYLNRKYHLINLDFSKDKFTLLLTLSVLNKPTKEIHIKVSTVTNEDINLLRQLLK